MARMWTLKPQFFLNELLAEMDPLGRLLFQGLWCIADREGRLEDRPKRIKAEVLPYDDVDVDHLLRLLHESGFILRYAQGGQRYIQVVNFSKHQSPHVKEAPSAIPAPCESDASTMPAPYSHRASTIPAPPDLGTDTVTVPGMETKREREVAPVASVAPTLGALALSPSSSPSSSSSPSPAPKLVAIQPIKRARPPDLLWDACVAACGGIAPSNRVERGKWNKGVAALRESRATPEEVAIRAARYRRRYGEEIALNPMALASNWTQLAQEVTHHARNTATAASGSGSGNGGAGSNARPYRGTHGAYTGPHLPDADEWQEWARKERAAGRTVIGG